MTLSNFQRVLLDDLEPDKWYCQYDVEQFSRFPEWFHRNQSQPAATLRPLVEHGYLEIKRVRFGQMIVPVYRKRNLC